MLRIGLRIVLLAMLIMGLCAALVSAFARSERETTMMNGGSISFGWFRVRWIGPLVLDLFLGPIMSKTITITKGSETVDIKLGDNMMTDIHLHGVDNANLEGQFKSPPVWTIDDPSIATITPSADGLNCHLEAAVPAKVGDTVLHVVDADDASVPGIDFNVSVVAEDISHLSATVDPPTERVAPTPTPAPPAPPAPTP